MKEYLKDLNERQREAVLHIDGPLMIVAGAAVENQSTDDPDRPPDGERD